MESGWESDVEVHKGWDLCLCGGGGFGGGGGVDGSDGGSVVDGSGGNSGVGERDESGVYRSGGSVVHGSVEVDCVGVVDALVFGVIFMVEGVELVVGCVVRLVLWCVNKRGYFLCCFSLKSVKMSGLSVGGFLFGMVIWGDCFILLELGFLEKMVGTDVLLDMVVVEIIVVETVDVVQVCFFQCVCLGDMMGVRVVREVVVDVVVFMWWRCSVVWEWVWELVV